MHYKFINDNLRSLNYLCIYLLNLCVLFNDDRWGYD